MSTEDDHTRAARSPFPGLRPFDDTDEDAALFCGRRTEAELVIANLRASPLTILYGPSGVGKSSLLRAAVVHQLTERGREAVAAGKPGPTVVLADEWARDPAGALAAAIDGRATADGDLEAAAERWTATHRGVLLLVFDQFEEYLRLHPAAEADPFDEAFAALACRADLSVHFLLSLRDDGLADLDRYEGAIPHLFGNYLRLPQLDRAGAREAIELPVARVAEWRTEAGQTPVTLEPGLTDTVLDELTTLSHRAGRRAEAAGDDAPVEPAFLQLVMRRLWETETAAGSTVLSAATLARLGGPAAIVAAHLDDAMARLSVPQQHTAEAVLRFLVTPSGAKVRYTADDLADYTGRPVAEVTAVLDALSDGDARILRRVPAPSGEDRAGYELFHDVLSGPVRDWRFRAQAERLGRRATRLLIAVAALTAIAAALVVYQLRPERLTRLELSSVDNRFAIRGDVAPDRNVVLLGIDDRTLSRYARDGERRLPRSTQARLLRAVAAGEPAVIVEDVEYEDGPRTDPAGTAALREALANAGAPVPLASSRIDDAGGTTLFGSRNGEATRAGYSGAPVDVDGTVRRIEASVRQPRGTGELPTLAARVAVAVGQNPSLPDDGAWIDFSGGPGTYRPVPAIDVLEGRVPRSRFSGRIVVIGLTAHGPGSDRGKVSAAGGSTMSGPEVQANAIATVLRRQPLKDASTGVVVALIIALGALPALVALRFRVRVVLAVSLVTAVLYLIAVQLTFDAGWVVPLVYPLVSLVLATLAVALIAALRAPARARSGQGSPAARSPRTSLRPLPRP